MQHENPLYSVRQKLEEKIKKYFSEWGRREAKINSDCYFSVFLLYTYIVFTILSKYTNIYWVLI